MGGSPCVVATQTHDQLTCTDPPASAAADVVLTTGGQASNTAAFSHQPAVSKCDAAKWKAAVAKNYLTTTTLATHGSVMSHRNNYLDLDPTYRNIYGQPLLRMTFDFTDNEHRMSKYITGKAADIARAMRPREIKVNGRNGHYSIVPYQTTHNTGGAIMGAERATSVVNPCLQSWDVHNLFVIGACAFPQNASYNPTGPVGALAYRAADAIVNRYLKNPGPLA